MRLKREYVKIQPATGAIVMANGIFLLGAIEAFPFLDLQLGKYLACLLVVLWYVIYKRLSIQFFQRDFLLPFLADPVNSFAIGTWIAGVSVLCNVMLKYFSSIYPLIELLAIFNTFLFIFFLGNVLYNYKRLLSDQDDYAVHGIILLATVATQSIVVLLNNVFPAFPSLLSQLMIILGLLFYLIGIILLIRRYCIGATWTLVADWTNTNCIIHGALSITGLAIVSATTFSSLFVSMLWLIIFGLLVIVEAIEVIRACLRVKKYGWKQGLFQYHVSQWSRNFTFGMFYTFTIYLHQNPIYEIPAALKRFQLEFLAGWAWLVFGILLVQISLYVIAKLKSKLDVAVSESLHSN